MGLIRQVIIAVVVGTTYRLLSAIFQVVWKVWSSPSRFTKWHVRACLVPDDILTTFTPSREALLLAVASSTSETPEETSFALFTHSAPVGLFNLPGGPGLLFVAIDVIGRAVLIKAEDALGFLGLSRLALTLPPTQTSRNTWVVKGSTSNQLVHRLFLSPNRGMTPHEISIQGFTLQSRELAIPVQEHKQLPMPLWELTALALEARSVEGVGGLRDEAMLRKVKEILA